MRSLSKSTWIMFCFDLMALFVSTFLCSNFFCYSDKSVAVLCFLVVAVGLTVLYLKGNYKIREFNITFKNTYLLFEGVVMTHIFPFLYLLIFTESKTNTLKFLIANILIIFILLRAYRALFHIYLFNIKKEKNILTLGANRRAKVIADEIQGKKALRMKVVAFVQVDNTDEDLITDSSIPVYKDITDLKQIIDEKDIDIVVISEATELILTIPTYVTISKMPDFYEMVTGKYFIDDRTITELYYNFIKNRSIIYDFCKRVYDIIAALIILIVTLPITGYIAIRVKMTDGASPFFTQTRVGKGGKTFECYKLRTMYINNYVPKDGNDVKYAESVKGDDRIIPFCRFVRKARFDEIPQMINILKGEMSIVGPRAEWVDEVKIFKQKIPYYSGRMWVKTGWTGWSHINMNPVFTIDEERERLEYDLYYIKHRNVLWEIFILVKAVFLALGGRHK